MNIGFSGLSTMNVKSASFGGSTDFTHSQVHSALGSDKPLPRWGDHVSPFPPLKIFQEQIEYVERSPERLVDSKDLRQGFSTRLQKRLSTGLRVPQCAPIAL